MTRAALWLVFIACFPTFIFVFGNLWAMVVVLVIALCSHAILAVMETRP